MDIDSSLRISAFNWLEKQVERYGDVLPRSLLEKGFIFQGIHIPLVSPQGIFKPKMLDIPLTIATTPKGPYSDSFVENKYLVYRYRGKDPFHRDNVGLRKAFELNKPLIYLYGLIPGRYMAVWPVFIVGDDMSQCTFTIAVDGISSITNDDNAYQNVAERTDESRLYITAVVKKRLHQRSFRERVIHAYREQCSLCRLKHNELLDAAHIIPDNEPESLPTVENGIALCKLHHAAFDKYILGITPDYFIEIREDILIEEDGPMLKHGLVELHGTKLVLPKSKIHWPKREFLERRFLKFKKVV